MVQLIRDSESVMLRSNRHGHSSQQQRNLRFEDVLKQKIGMHPDADISTLFVLNFVILSDEYMPLFKSSINAETQQVVMVKLSSSAEELPFLSYVFSKGTDFFLMV